VARSLVHRFRRRTAPRGEGLRPAHFRAGRSASGGACTSARSASIACRTCTWTLPRSVSGRRRLNHAISAGRNPVAPSASRWSRCSATRRTTAGSGSSSAPSTRSPRPGRNGSRTSRSASWAHISPGSAACSPTPNPSTGP